MNPPDRAVLSDDEIALLIFSRAGASSLTGDMARRAIDTIWALQKERDQIRQTLEGIVADKYPAPPNLYLTELQRQLKAAIQRFDDAEQTIRRLEHDITAYRGSLGYSCPGDHNGFLMDGTLPVNGIAEAQYETIRRLEGEVVEWEREYRNAREDEAKMKQRAEAAEGRVRELELALKYPFPEQRGGY